MIFARPPFVPFGSSHELRTRRLAVAVALVAAACSSSGYDGVPMDPGNPGGGGAAVDAATVEASPAIRFTPQSVTLKVGGTVTFAFGSVPHNVFFDNAPAGAPQNITAATTNQSIARTFPSAGRYTYNCHIHPGMSGTVTVQ